MMSNGRIRLTFEQLSYIIEKTEISEPKKAVERFAEIMKKEGIPPRKIIDVVQKLMEREKRGIK